MDQAQALEVCPIAVAPLGEDGSARRPAEQEGSPDEDPDDPPLLELLDAYLVYSLDYGALAPLTVTAYRRDCTRFVKWLLRDGRHVAPSAVTSADIRAYLASLKKLSPATKRRALYAISSFMNHLVETEILPSNPCRLIKPPKKTQSVPRVLSSERCEQLLAACADERERLIVGLLLLAGLRRGEVLGLDVADVAADLSSLRVLGKGRKERVLPINEQLRTHIAEYLAVRESESPALIVNDAGRRMQPNSLYRILDRLKKAVGIAPCEASPHTLRHSFATRLCENNVDIKTLSELMGHSNIATTSVYLHTTSERKREAVESLCGGRAT